MEPVQISPIIKLYLDLVCTSRCITKHFNRVKEELDNGTEMGFLSVSIEGSHDGIPHGSFLGDSLEVKKNSM